MASERQRRHLAEQREKRTREKHERWATEMRRHGYMIMSPESVTAYLESGGLAADFLRIHLEQDT